LIRPAVQGTVTETQKKFWSTKDPGQKPFTYQVDFFTDYAGSQACLCYSVLISSSETAD
jgi:hypothetical protein